MDLVLALMVSYQAPTEVQSSGIRSLGNFSTKAPWDSSLIQILTEVLFFSILLLPGMQVPQAADGHSFWEVRAELRAAQCVT